MITTPDSFTVKVNNATAQFIWSSDFGKNRTALFQKAQMYIDSEVLRFCSPRVPFRTGALEKSGATGTVIGSGLVQYTMPYSAFQYYNTATTRTYDPNRGAKWFERGKAVMAKKILAGAQKIAGGGTV